MPPRPGNRHYSLATYILLRGITLLIRVGNKERNKQRHPALHTLLAPTRIQHGDTLLMCAACECQPVDLVHIVQCTALACSALDIVLVTCSHMFRCAQQHLVCRVASSTVPSTDLT
jgi:hypothetical protein